MQVGKVNFVPQEANNQEALKDNQASYNITFSINRAYLLFAMVTLYSLLKNNSKYYFNIYILHNDCLKEEEINKITKQHPLNQYNNFKIHLVDVSHIKELNDLVPIGKWTKEIYFKLFLGDLLKQADNVLFLDVDLIVKGDIGELFREIKLNTLFIGSSVQKSNTKKGLNAGCLLINLKLYREINAKNFILKALKDSPTKTEEATINEIYRDNMSFFSKQDVLTTHMHKKGMFENITFDDVKVIHYTASKPWTLEKSNYQFRKESIKDFWNYLQEFINKDDLKKFKFLKFYAIYIAHIINSPIRRINSKIYKVKNKKYFMKSFFIENKINKYSSIKEEYYQ